MSRIFNPLKADNPLVVGDDICPICRLQFCAGQRITLAPARMPQQGVENVPAVPLHAACAFRGMKTSKGTIEHVKDGDASPFPIVTEQGQFTLEELDLA